MFSHQALFSLCLNVFLIGTAWLGKTRVGKSARKQGLNKPDLTYFVKRLKCKLTENILTRITCF